MSAATQRLAHSRNRIRRHLLRNGVADHQQQRRARSRRRQWVGVAVLVGAMALVLAWHRPWRRSPGMASTVAWVVACMKAPGMLHTLAGHMDTLATWWRTLTASVPPGGMDGDANGAADNVAQPATPATSEPGRANR